jgi:hypothetical protein
MNALSIELFLFFFNFSLDGSRSINSHLMYLSYKNRKKIKQRDFCNSKLVNGWNVGYSNHKRVIRVSVNDISNLNA